MSGTRSPVSTFRRILGPGFDRPNEMLGPIFPLVVPCSWQCPIDSRTTIWMAVSLVGTWFLESVPQVDNFTGS